MPNETITLTPDRAKIPNMAEKIKALGLWKQYTELLSKGETVDAIEKKMRHEMNASNPEAQRKARRKAVSDFHKGLASSLPDTTEKETVRIAQEQLGHRKAAIAAHLSSKAAPISAELLEIFLQVILDEIARVEADEKRIALSYGLVFVRSHTLAALDSLAHYTRQEIAVARNPQPGTGGSVGKTIAAYMA